jgi:nicotinamidase-related amidase
VIPSSAIASPPVANPTDRSAYLTHRQESGDGCGGSSVSGVATTGNNNTTTANTAVVTMELQRGVCGDLAPTDHLTSAVNDAGVPEAAGRLVTGARRNGVTVMHCVFTIRPDGAGTNFDLPLMAAAAADPSLLRSDDPSSNLLAQIGPGPGDLISERHHGLTPFTGTDLAQRLQEVGVQTLVVCGVSLNIGIPGLVTEAVGEGFDVIVATDAVVGLPASFGHDVLRHALAYVAQLATVDDIVARWDHGTGV